MGHYKIQTQNVKKTNINYQQWRIQIKVAKTWRKIQICEQRGRLQQCRTKKWRRIWFFSLKWAQKCAQKRKLNEVTYTEREKTRVNTWIISYTDMTCMESCLIKETKLSSLSCSMYLKLRHSSWMLSLAADAKCLNCITFLVTARQWWEVGDVLSEV